MGEYEPDDSRDVTLSDRQAPGEPPRTGPREEEARATARPKEHQGRRRPRAAGQADRARRARQQGTGFCG